MVFYLECAYYLNNVQLEMFKKLFYSSVTVFVIAHWRYSYWQKNYFKTVLLIVTNITIRDQIKVWVL